MYQSDLQPVFEGGALHELPDALGPGLGQRVRVEGALDERDVRQVDRQSLGAEDALNHRQVLAAAPHPVFHEVVQPALEQGHVIEDALVQGNRKTGAARHLKVADHRHGLPWTVTPRWMAGWPDLTDVNGARLIRGAGSFQAVDGLCPRVRHEADCADQGKQAGDDNPGKSWEKQSSHQCPARLSGLNADRSTISRIGSPVAVFSLTPGRNGEHAVFFAQFPGGRRDDRPLGDKEFTSRPQSKPNVFLTDEFERRLVGWAGLERASLAAPGSGLVQSPWIRETRRPAVPGLRR